MDKSKRILIIIALCAAIGCVIWLKQDDTPQTDLTSDHNNNSQVAASQAQNDQTDPTSDHNSTDQSIPSDPSENEKKSSETQRIKLVDLGSDKCIPCKMMMPILESLKTEFADQLLVEVIDVHKDSSAIGMYDVQIIPTQIFYDSAGRELFRHEGYYSREDILTKWQELGFDLNTPNEDKNS